MPDELVDRTGAHAALDGVLDLIEAARSKSGEPIAGQCDEAAQASLALLECLAGPEIGLWLYDAGCDGPNPMLPKAHIDTQRIQRAYAQLILALNDTLEMAKLEPGIVTRDLVQMSIPGGSSPQILVPPSRGKGEKDHRDLKLAAQRRIAQCVYFEKVRTNQTIEATLSRLRPVNDDAQGRLLNSQTKNWKNCAKTLSQVERKRARLAGKKASKPHPDVMGFLKLWTIATMK